MAVIPHTAPPSHSKLQQGKFLTHDSPTCSTDRKKISPFFIDRLVLLKAHLVSSEIILNVLISLGMLSPSLYSSPLSSSATPTGTTPVPSTSSPLKDSPSPGTASTQPSPARRGPQSPQALMPLPCKKGEALQYHNFKCPECQAQFSSKAELVTHFQQIRATPNSVSCNIVNAFKLFFSVQSIRSIETVFQIFFKWPARYFVNCTT